MDYSPTQQQALSQIEGWCTAGRGGVFRLFGFAGTGKTTLAKTIAANAPGRVYFASYTGKAASVMRAKGCPEATTIHKLIYSPVERSSSRLKSLEKAQKQSPTPERAREILKEKENLNGPRFALNRESVIKGASLLVLDECSMIDARMGSDLLSFRVPTLVLGDPAQLPPVRGSGFFMQDTPDVLLTEVHRQARGNPVLDLATRVREGKRLERGEFGESRVVDQIGPEDALGHDQILVGTNKKRHAINKRVRSLLGFTSPLPVDGDKLICLKNNHENGLLNGTMWTCVGDAEVVSEVGAVIEVESEAGDRLVTSVYTPSFGGGGGGSDAPYWLKDGFDEFDFGYAITTHKAQGSQWGSVLIFDESYCFRQSRLEWMYTALTRAADRVTVVL